MSPGTPNQKAEDRYWMQYPSPNWEMCLIICLDTNVFLRHAFSIAHLESIAELSTVFTRAELILPEVVERECKALFGDKVALAHLSKALRPPELDRAFSLWKRRCAKHFEKWRTRVRQLARRIPTSDELLRRAYERLMKKEPPCHDRDETRDAIIWESVLAEQPFARRVLVFVTDNSKDFPFATHTRLRDEAREAGVLWFKTYADLQQWARPIQIQPWEAGVPFGEWYERQDLSRYTAERLEDELPEYLMGVTEHFDADAEISSLERTSCELPEDAESVNVPCEHVITETWDFSVSYSVSADIQVGGHNGIEVSASGHAQASGHAKLTRTLTFDQDRKITSHEIQINEIDLEQEEDWDPYEAWVNSLGEGRYDS